MDKKEENYDLNNWKIKIIDNTLQQTNHSDCGVCCYHNIYSIAIQGNHNKNIFYYSKLKNIILIYIIYILYTLYFILYILLKT